MTMLFKGKKHPGFLHPERRFPFARFTFVAGQHLRFLKTPQDGRASPMEAIE
jgi:hypothetical protein